MTKGLLAFALLLSASISTNSQRPIKPSPSIEFRGSQLNVRPLQNPAAGLEIKSLSIKELDPYNFKIGDIILKSHSSKPIQGVAYTWYLADSENRILHKGLSTGINMFPRSLQRGMEIKSNPYDLTIGKLMLRRVESDREYSILIEIENVSYVGGKSLVPRIRAMKI